MIRSLSSAASILLLTAAASSQAVAPGFRMIGPHATTESYLLDTNGAVVHTWPSGFTPGVATYVLDDGTLMRTVSTPGSPGIGGAGGGIQRIAFDGTLLWDFRYDGPGYFHHHDVEALPNGNVLLIAWEEKASAEAIAAGRNPGLLSGPFFRPERLVEIQPTGLTTGAVVWEWHLWDHLIQDHDSSKANFGIVGNHPELLDINYPPVTPSNGDFNHANAIDYDADNDWIVFSAHAQDEIWIIDHSTSSAEAAGHSGGTHGKGGDLLYRWGNPAAYRAGTVADQKLFNQHGALFIEDGLPGAGNIILFNNQVGGNYSAVHELELPINGAGGFDLLPDGTYGPAGPVWQYTAPTPTDFFSPFLSNAVRLPNGNTLVDSGAQGWFFEVTVAKEKVWEHFNTLPFPGVNVFRISYVERSLWADGETLSTASGGSVQFDIVAGTPHAGSFYLLLGSASGTSPGIVTGAHTLPLSLDAYLLFTLKNPGSALLPGSFGTLNALGSATANFTLPGGTSLAGLTLDHAYAVLDPTTLVVAHTSNAVPLELVP